MTRILPWSGQSVHWHDRVSVPLSCPLFLCPVSSAGLSPLSLTACPSSFSSPLSSVLCPLAPSVSPSQAVLCPLSAVLCQSACPLSSVLSVSSLSSVLSRAVCCPRSSVCLLLCPQYWESGLRCCARAPLSVRVRLYSVQSVSSPLSVCLPPVFCPQCQFPVLCPVTGSLLSSLLCQSPALSSVPGIGTEVLRPLGQSESGCTLCRCALAGSVRCGAYWAPAAPAAAFPPQSGSLPISIRRNKKIKFPLRARAPHVFFFLRTKALAVTGSNGAAQPSMELSPLRDFFLIFFGWPRGQNYYKIQKAQGARAS